jgi:hypothetical protein
MKHLTTLLSILLVLGLLVGAIALDAHARNSDDDDYTLRVVGLSITLPDENDEDLVPTIPDGLRVYFAADFEGKNVIGVDEDNYTLTSFKDDKRNTLLSSDISDHGFFEGLDVDTFFNENPNRILFSFRATSMPDTDATEVTLEAMIPVLCGDDLTSLTTTQPIANDDEVPMGDYNFKIDSIEQDDDDPDLVMVYLKSSTGFAPVTSLTFVDADNNELDSDSYGTSTMTMNGVTSYSQAHEVTAPADGIYLKVEYYESIETIEIDVDVDISVGLEITD